MTLQETIAEAGVYKVDHRNKEIDGSAARQRGASRARRRSILFAAREWSRWKRQARAWRRIPVAEPACVRAMAWV
eukprot:390984-Pleurochrysis_carterae.AAC.1